MTWTIYSIGDAALLSQVLNAIAALSRTPDMLRLTEIGFMIGVLYVAIESIMKGVREINFQSFLMAYLGYMVMFGSSVSVIVQDVYTDQVYVVGNVPLGIGIPGAMLSQIGKGITDLFEQAFSTPKMMTDGFAGSLQTLMAVRKFNSLGPALNQGGGNDEDVTASVQRFEHDCVGNNLGAQIPQSQVESATDFLESLTGYMSEEDTTVLNITEAANAPSSTSVPFVGSVVAYNVNCKDAARAIKQRFNVLEQDPRYGNVFSAQAGCTQAAIASNTCNKVDQLGNALSALTQSMNDNLTMMRNGFFGFYYRDALRTANGTADANTEAMIYQADEQRAAQETGNANMFARMVRPMLTFMEAFNYAITPIVMFLIGVGALGFSMIFRYLQMAMWIQLWLPLMSLLNLYVNFIAQGRLAAFQASTGLDPTSVIGIANMAGFEDYLATVGVLATSIPGLAMFLVYGGSVAATSVAGRMQAGNFINEKMTAPDIETPSAVMNTQLGYQSDITGIHKTGAENQVSTVNVGQTASTAASSSHTELAQSSSQFMETLGRTISSGHGSATSAGAAEVLTNSLRNSNAASYQAALSAVHQASEGYNLSEAQQEQIAASWVEANITRLGVGGELGLGVDVGKGKGVPQKVGEEERGASESAKGRLGYGVKAGFDVDASTAKVTTNSGSKSAQHTLSDVATKAGNILLGSDNGQTFTTTLASDLAHNVQNMSDAKFQTTFGETDDKGIRSQAAQVASTADQYQKADTIAHTFGTNLSRKTSDIAAQAIRNGSFGAAMGLINKYLQTDNPADTAFADGARQWTAQNKETWIGDQGKLMGYLEAFNNTPANESTQAARSKLMTQVLAETGVANVGAANPYADEGIAHRQAPPQVQPAAEVTHASYDGARQELSQKQAAATEASHDHGEVQAAATAGQVQQKTAAASNDGAVRQRGLSESIKTLADVTPIDLDGVMPDPHHTQTAQQIARAKDRFSAFFGGGTMAEKTGGGPAYVDALRKASDGPLLKTLGHDDLSYSKISAEIAPQLHNDKDFTALYAAAGTQALFDPKASPSVLADHFRPIIEKKFEGDPNAKQATENALNSVIAAAREGGPNGNSRLSQVKQFLNQRDTGAATDFKDNQAFH